jgi:hypothetical protein
MHRAVRVVYQIHDSPIEEAEEKGPEGTFVELEDHLHVCRDGRVLDSLCIFCRQCCGSTGVKDGYQERECLLVNVSECSRADCPERSHKDVEQSRYL